MTKLWSEDVEHPCITRYNRNGIPYQVNHDRYATSGGERMRNGFQYSISAHETHHNERDPDEGQKPQQRRRIPVAVRISCYLKRLTF